MKGDPYQTFLMFMVLIILGAVLGMVIEINQTLSEILAAVR